MSTIKLTTKQIEVLRYIAKNGRITWDNAEAPARASLSYAALQRAGLLTAARGGGYDISDAGREYVNRAEAA